MSNDAGPGQWRYDEISDDPPRASVVRIISYGGGVQSTALIVLAVQGKVEADRALYANVGDDSEHPATNAYVRDVMIPWAAERGFPVEQLHRVRRDGTSVTLWQKLMVPDSRSVDIPVRMANGAPGRRSCTADFKIKVVTKRLRELGATKAAPADVLIGFSTDEFQRASNRRASPFETPQYPLLDLGLSRGDCQHLIAEAGLPVPHKSACYFCPFHRTAAWAEMRRDEPALFAKSVELEATLNRRRDMLGKDHVWLTRFNKPLDEAITEAQTPLFDGDGPEGCDDGGCWT